MNYILIILCLVFDFVYILCKKTGKNIIGLFAKSFAAICFISLGYLGYKSHTTNFSYLILLGLILDGIGDLFLAIRNIFAKNITFLLGALFFLAGHIVYIKALFPIDNNYLLQTIIFGVVAGTLLFTLFKKACKFSSIYNVVGIIYCIMILIMALLCVGIYFTNQSLNHLLFMLGAALFVCSDCILILYNFSKKERWMHPTYSLLYFIGQILISLSLGI